MSFIQNIICNMVAILFRPQCVNTPIAIILALKQLVIFFSSKFLMSFTVNVILSMELIKFSTVVTGGLVIKHQGIRSHSADYAPMHFQLFGG